MAKDSRDIDLGLGSSEQRVLGIHLWRDVATELHDVCERAFHLLRGALRFDQGALFLFNAKTQVFYALKVMSHGEILDGEEEMPLAPQSPLWKIVRHKKDFLVLGPPEHAAFIALEAFSNVLGILRIDRGRSRRPFGPKERDYLLRLAGALSTAIWRINLSVQERMWSTQLRTFNEVSVLVHQSLRVKKLLEAVAKKIVRNLGFDQVKFYLADAKKKVLRGEMGYAIFSGHMDITDEVHSLKSAGNPMVDLLTGGGNPILESYKETIRYIPLRARKEVMGVLMVDNVLSQQEITTDEIQLLESLAGQLGLAIKNAELYEGVEELSITDQLTRLYLPRYFRERLEQECLRGARSNAHFAVCMVDIDFFKRVNDTYGHPVGDRVLQELSRQLQLASRKIDVVARYGGDEFIILLPNTNPDQAQRFAQRLRQKIYDIAFPLSHDQSLRISISAGISIYPTHSTQSEDLIQMADKALYWSKSSGRNEVRLFSLATRKGG